jgi:small subunit ribosomal protein S4
MKIKPKYSTRRKDITMSWNKYNIYNIKTLYKLKKNKTRKSAYKIALSAKQNLRKYYGHLRENQFKKIYKAVYNSSGFSQKNLFIYLERRLDVVLFRINFAPSIFTARQLINHGHILVNNKLVTTPSILIHNGDLIQVKKKSFKFIKSLILFKKFKSKIFLLKKYKMLSTPKYITINYNILSAIFIRSPKIYEIAYPFIPRISSIVQYYNRMGI